MNKNSRSNSYMSKILKVQKLPYGQYLHDGDVIQVGDLKLWYEGGPSKLKSEYMNIGETIGELAPTTLIFGYYRPALTNKRFRWLKVGEVIRDGDELLGSNAGATGGWVKTGRAGQVTACNNFYRRRRHVRTRP
jgi:hypothetical protein